MMEKANNKMTVGRFIFSSLITILIFPAVILFLSGDWLWLEGWIFSLWFDAMVLSSIKQLLKIPIFQHWSEYRLIANSMSFPQGCMAL